MWLFQPRNQAWLFPALRQLWHRSPWPIAPLFLQVAVPVIHQRKKSLEVGRREPLDVTTSGSLRFLLVNARQLGMAVGFCLTLALISTASGCDTSDDTDFPKSAALPKKTNRPLLLAFLGTDGSISGFPTVVVLSPAGEEVGRIGYVPGGVEKFAAAVNKLILKGRPSGQ